MGRGKCGNECGNNGDEDARVEWTWEEWGGMGKSRVEGVEMKRKVSE